MAAVTVTKKRKAHAVDDKPTKKPKKVIVEETASKVTKPTSKKSTAPKDAEQPTKTKTVTKKTTTSKPAPKSKKEPAEDKVSIDVSEDESDEDDQTAALLAGFESSDDDEIENPDAEALALAELPAPPTTALQKTANASSEDPNKPGVLYVGRVPHGFFEHQMKAYFAQFGEINRLRLSRNRRTGASRHYAFIEFASSEVAGIVAETMNNYLLFGHLLKVKLLAPEQVHADLFKGAGKRFKKVPWNRIERFNVEKSDRKGWAKRVSKEEKRRKAKEESLKKLGYEFEMPALKSVESVPAQKAVEGTDAPLLIEAKGAKEANTIESVLDKSVLDESVLGNGEAKENLVAATTAGRGKRSKRKVVK